MTFGEYLAGSIELIAIAAAIAFAAVRLRGRLLPGWSGASARLAEVVLGISLLVVVLELVGVVGLYRPGWVLAGAVLAGVGLGIAAGRPGEGPALPAPAVAPYALAIAVAGSLLVAAHWAMPTQVGLDIGMYLPNTTWHNAPFAARFVQEAQVGALHFTEVLRLTVWFYPQNSELLHSAGVLFLGNDFLSPLINIGWMALCLLAAWSFGRPYGAGAAALLGVALILDAEMLLLYQPGDAKNDTAGLFFLLAAAAILVNAEAQRRATADQGGTPPSGGPRLGVPLSNGALVVAGLAAGLALGTKLNLLAPFGLLTLGVIAVTAGYRVRATLVWVASSLVTGGFWFARNLVEAGNPLPWADAGPLPGPDQLDIDIREPHTVSDYLTDADVITDSFIPSLNDSFGVLWPIVLAAVIGGFILAIFRGRTSVIRMLGVVALLSGIAYLFTPLTAAGPEGAPSAFEVNLRYASPALALGALLLAVDPWLSRERIQPIAARRALAAVRCRAGKRRRRRLAERLHARRHPPRRSSSSACRCCWRWHRAGASIARRSRSPPRWPSASPSASAGPRTRTTSTTAIGPPRPPMTSRRGSGRPSPGSTRKTPRLPDRGGRRPPRLQAVRLLRRRPLQPRPVRRPPRPPRRLSADRKRGSSEARRRRTPVPQCEEWKLRAQRRATTTTS